MTLERIKRAIKRRKRLLKLTNFIETETELQDVNGFEEDSEDEDNANAASAAAAAVPGICLIESAVVLLRSYQYSFGAHLAALFRLD